MLSCTPGALTRIKRIQVMQFTEEYELRKKVTVPYLFSNMGMKASSEITNNLGKRKKKGSNVGDVGF